MEAKNNKKKSGIKIGGDIIALVSLIAVLFFFIISDPSSLTRKVTDIIVENGTEKSFTDTATGKMTSVYVLVQGEDTLTYVVDDVTPRTLVIANNDLWVKDSLCDGNHDKARFREGGRHDIEALDWDIKQISYVKEMKKIIKRNRK